MLNIEGSLKGRKAVKTITICSKCGGSGLLKIVEDYSPWGLHQLGLREPFTMAIIRCQKCGYTVRRITGKGETDKASERAKIAFSEGRDNDSLFDQWDEAEKLSARTPIIKPGKREMLFHAGVKADFALRCKGNSMIPTFYPGELAFIRIQRTFIDGQIAVVQYDNVTTLKRVFRLPDGFKLVPDNPVFDPVVIIGKESERAQIIGVAVARR